ncbi:MAG: hypothetical protein K2Y21_05340 [Phycisphaerales bacterium]|nr:hypothetical protein [Phycisphaerales bacterium]
MRDRSQPQRRPVHGPRPPGPVDPVRDRVTGLVASMVATFPDLPLGAEFTEFEGRDAAFAHAIHDAVLRRWLTLELLIGLGLDRPFRSLEPGLQAVLLVGAAQMVLLDKVPPHAAIDQSVHIAKARIRIGAGGLVNAVLRRVTELCGERTSRGTDWRTRLDAIPLGDGRSLLLTRACLPTDEVKRIAAITSTPKPLFEKWVQAFGIDAASAIALKGIGTAPTVVNAEARPEAARALVLDGDLSPHSRELSFVWRGERRDLSETLDRSGLWVQDPASAEVVRTVAAAAGKDASNVRLVVDLCAGQGTKTRQLLRAFPNATVIACEVDDERLATLKRVFAKEPRIRVLHAQHATRTCQDGGVGVADVVLLDVPCSNSGVLSRRVEARYRLDAAAIAELVKLQREILATGRSLLKPGGLLAYSTCSLEHEENESQRDHMVEALGCVLMVDRRTMPAGLPGEDHALFHDGSYVTVGRVPG